MKAVELNPDRFNFPSIKSAMQELQEKPRIVFVTELSRIEYFYKQNYNFPGFKVIKEKKIQNVGFIFPKYSPLKPLFFQYGLQLLNSRAYDKLAIHWIGHGIPSSEESFPVISLVHTLVCFIFLVSFMALCIIVLGAECIINKFHMEKIYPQKNLSRQMKDIIKENGNLDQNNKCRNEELRRKLLEMSVQNAVLQHNIQTLKSELEQYKSNM